MIRMTTHFSRRQLVSSASGLAILSSASFAQAPVSTPAEWLPLQDPTMVKEIVGVSHSNVKRVLELVESHPALANAAIDWGFGDWESALGAAAHTGRREIAEVLLAHGAGISIFASAMLGQLDVVKALVAARPGVQRSPGAHGITLLAHAKGGGADAAAVVSYLEGLGDADIRPALVPLEAGERDAIVGRYAFGAGPRDYFEIDVRNDMKGLEQVGIERPGLSRHVLAHLGGLVFFPPGAHAVKIAFARDKGKATQFTIADPQVMLTAKRQ